MTRAFSIIALLAPVFAWAQSAGTDVGNGTGPGGIATITAGAGGNTSRVGGMARIVGGFSGTGATGNGGYVTGGIVASMNGQGGLVNEVGDSGTGTGSSHLAAPTHFGITPR